MGSLIRNSPIIKTIQEWEGYVVRISEDTFDAVLLDISQKKTATDEFAAFKLSNFSEEDIKRLQVGTVFRWVMGYSDNPTEYCSNIYLVELGEWTEEDENAAHRRAVEMSAKLTWI